MMELKIATIEKAVSNQKAIIITSLIAHYLSCLLTVYINHLESMRFVAMRGKEKRKVLDASNANIC